MSKLNEVNGAKRQSLKYSSKVGFVSKCVFHSNSIRDGVNWFGS